LKEQVHGLKTREYERKQGNMNWSFGEYLFRNFQIQSTSELTYLFSKTIKTQKAMQYFRASTKAHPATINKRQYLVFVLCSNLFIKV